MICMETRSNQMPSSRLQPDLVAHFNASGPDEGHRSPLERLLSIDFARRLNMDVSRMTNPPFTAHKASA